MALSLYNFEPIQKRLADAVRLCFSDGEFSRLEKTSAGGYLQEDVRIRDIKFRYWVSPAGEKIDFLLSVLLAHNWRSSLWIRLRPAGLTMEGVSLEGASPKFSKPKSQHYQLIVKLLAALGIKVDPETQEVEFGKEKKLLAKLLAGE